MWKFEYKTAGKGGFTKSNLDASEKKKKKTQKTCTSQPGSAALVNHIKSKVQTLNIVSVLFFGPFSYAHKGKQAVRTNSYFSSAETFSSAVEGREESCAEDAVCTEHKKGVGGLFGFTSVSKDGQKQLSFSTQRTAPCLISTVHNAINRRKTFQTVDCTIFIVENEAQTIRRLAFVVT